MQGHPAQVQQVGIPGQQQQQLKDAQLQQQQLVHLIQQQQSMQQGNIVVKMTDVQPISSVGKYF